MFETEHRNEVEQHLAAQKAKLADEQAAALAKLADEHAAALAAQEARLAEQHTKALAAQTEQYNNALAAREAEHMERIRVVELATKHTEQAFEALRTLKRPCEEASEPHPASKKQCV